jgi:hypothetical protein
MARVHECGLAPRRWMGDAISLDGFTIPVTFDRLTVLAALLTILAVVLFISGIVRILRERRIRIFRIGGGLLLLLLGLAVFAVAGWAQTYQALTSRVLVATVRATPLSGQSQTMTVVYTPVINGTAGQAQTFTIKGDEWLLGGDIIKWSDWVNLLGVHTGYRITRLMGYYQDANDYRTKKVSAYDLASAHDTVSTFLHDHPKLMPFVQATYGNDVRMPPNPRITYQVYLSTSGYWAAQA